jgi:chitinase
MDRILLAYAMPRAVVSERDAQRLTHLCVAFAKLDSNGVFTCDHPLQAQFAQLRAWNPNLKLLASIVSADPAAFTRCAADPALRETMAQNCAAFLSEYGYDGVDFDWEYPCVPSNGIDSSPDDKPNFTLFLAAVRRAIGDKLLTIAAGADVYYVENIETEKVGQLCDFINVMTYDLKCGFHALAGHHTNLYASTGDYFRNSCDIAMRMFERYGVPKDKLVMGAGFYSRKWEGVRPANNGFLQIAQKAGGYGPGFTDLMNDYIDKNGYTRYWDDEAKAPYLSNGSTLISYDDELSLAHKAAYVIEHDYRGLFYWEHGSDPSGTLLTATHDHLFPTKEV